MPELPEVETMVQGIRQSIEGGVIDNLLLCPCAYRPLDIKPTWKTIQRKTKGQTIIAVRRLAKRVVMELSSGDSFLIEPRMTGLMLLSDPPDEAHLRIEWRLIQNGKPQSLWFWDRRGLGTLRLYSPAEIKSHLGPKTLGPDALTMTAAQWLAGCQRTKRAIKVVLLDQKFIAGIGNIYASEILHQAGVSPFSPANVLGETECEQLAESTQSILENAIAAEGSTLGDGTYRNALNQIGSYQNQHRVYQKQGEICASCRTGVIQRKVQAQRATFFCPICQPSEEFLPDE